jgi:hypothetical protein
LFADVRLFSPKIAGFAVTFAVIAANKSGVLKRLLRAFIGCVSFTMLDIELQSCPTSRQNEK